MSGRRRWWIGIGSGVVLGAAGVAIMITGVLAPAPPQKVSAACQLPIVLRRSGTAGFLHYPERTFTTVSGVPNGAESYDAILGRWLSVPWYDIAPDGRSYAYTVPPAGEQAESSAVHVVDAHGDRVVWHGSGKAVLDGMGVGAVYFTVIVSGQPPTTVAVSSQGGRVRQVHGSGLVGPDGALWGEDATQDVVRIDPKTGSRTVWWSPADSPSSVFANVVTFDQRRRPVILVQSMGVTSQALTLLAAPHQLITIWTSQGNDPWVTSAAADGHGIWLARDDGSVALWTPAHGLAEMLPPLPDGRGNPAVILGPCA